MTMNAYEKEALVKRASQQQLIAVMQGQSDAFPQWMALAELNNRREMGVANDGMKAQQQLAQGKQTVKDRKMAEMLPEMQGIGQLPAPNMGELAAAHGGIMSYADGGEVARFSGAYGSDVDGEDLSYEDRMAKWREMMGFGSQLPPAKRRYASDYAAGKVPAPTPVAPAAAPAATPAVEPVKAPEGVKKALATVAQPKQPVEDPTKAEVANLDKTLASTEKLYDFLDKKFGAQLDPIKAQLEKDREDYKTMKSENVGLALLGAAGALLKPGRSTASAIGEGLSTLGEYGMRFQPQLLAARQGISAGEVGLAQAQAQAARGNFGTAAQLVGQDQTRALQERELAIKEPLYRAQAGYYGAAAGAKSGAGTGLNQLRALQSSIQAELKGLQGKVDPASQDRARLLQQQLAQISQRLASGAGLDLTTGFVGGRDATGKAYRSSLFEE